MCRQTGTSNAQKQEFGCRQTHAFLPTRVSQFTLVKDDQDS
jgi:hypothetical protein